MPWALIIDNDNGLHCELFRTEEAATDRLASLVDKWWMQRDGVKPKERDELIKAYFALESVSEAGERCDIMEVDVPAEEAIHEQAGAMLKLLQDTIDYFDRLHNHKTTSVNTFIDETGFSA